MFKNFHNNLNSLD